MRAGEIVLLTARLLPALIGPRMFRLFVPRLFVSGLFVLGLLAIESERASAAEEMPSFRIDMHGDTITPTRLEVPANTPFKLEITNSGSIPAEFESVSLHKEKVLAAGATSSLVFRRLPPGTYDFFDDFHPEAKAVLVAR